MRITTAPRQHKAFPDRTDLRLRNDLYCVEWGVKLYSLTHSLTELIVRTFIREMTITSFC